jgi:hypothetical protein
MTDRDIASRIYPVLDKIMYGKLNPFHIKRKDFKLYGESQDESWNFFKKWLKNGIEKQYPQIISYKK